MLNKVAKCVRENDRRFGELNIIPITQAHSFTHLLKQFIELIIYQVVFQKTKTNITKFLPSWILRIPILKTGEYNQEKIYNIMP